MRKPVLPYANNKGADQPSLCRKSNWFESYLVENPKDMFSRNEAQIHSCYVVNITMEMAP